MRMTIATLIFAFSLGAAAAHDGVHVERAYALTTMANATTGAVFMEIINHAAAEDRLLSAQSDVAGTVQLHTHTMTAEGMMQMLHVEEGFVIPPSGTHALDRGGDHVMLIGLVRPLAVNDRFTLTLTFENAGKVVVVVPVGDPAADADGPAAHGEHGSHEPATE